MGNIESVKIIRAESLSDSAKLKWGITEGFVEIISSRNSPAIVDVKKLGKSPGITFREVMGSQD